MQEGFAFIFQDIIALIGGAAIGPAIALLAAPPAAFLLPPIHSGAPRLIAGACADIPSVASGEDKSTD